MQGDTGDEQRRGRRRPGGGEEVVLVQVDGNRGVTNLSDALDGDGVVARGHLDERGGGGGGGRRQRVVARHENMLHGAVAVVRNGRLEVDALHGHGRRARRKEGRRHAAGLVLWQGQGQLGGQRVSLERGGGGQLWPGGGGGGRRLRIDAGLRGGGVDAARRVRGCEPRRRRRERREARGLRVALLVGEAHRARLAARRGGVAVPPPLLGRLAAGVAARVMHGH